MKKKKKEFVYLRNMKELRAGMENLYVDIEAWRATKHLLLCLTELVDTKPR